MYWVDEVLDAEPDAGRIIVFNITDPTDPVPIVADSCLGAEPFAIRIKDNYAYVADGWGGLMIIDISDPYNIDSVGCFKIPERAVYNVYIKGNLVYLLTHVQLPAHVSGGEIYVLDITDRANPFLVTHYDSLQSPRDVFVDEPYVLVTDYTSLLVFEASFLHIPGDANGDGQVNGADVVFIINYLYRQGTPPDPMEAADANGDCVVNASDVVYLLNYLFRNGPPPQSGCAF